VEFRVRYRCRSRGRESASRRTSEDILTSSALSSTSTAEPARSSAATPARGGRLRLLLTGLIGIGIAVVLFVPAWLLSTYVAPLLGVVTYAVLVAGVALYLWRSDRPDYTPRHLASRQD
jgi:hypothetical protein